MPREGTLLELPLCLAFSPGSEPLKSDFLCSPKLQCFVLTAQQKARVPFYFFNLFAFLCLDLQPLTCSKDWHIYPRLVDLKMHQLTISEFSEFSFLHKIMVTEALASLVISSNRYFCFCSWFYLTFSHSQQEHAAPHGQKWGSLDKPPYPRNRVVAH